MDMKLAEKTKALPWLKRLLDDDDSSDAASPLSNASPKKETYSVTKEGGAIPKKRRGGSSDEDASEIPKALRKSSEGKRRQVRRGSSSGKGITKIRRGLSESSDSDDMREKQPRRLKKSPKAVNFVRHKHSHSHSVGSSRSVQDERSLNSTTTKMPADEAKSNATASREQRKRKLHALRVSTGEHDRIAAFKLKRLQARETLKMKDTSEGGKNDCIEEKQVVEAQATTHQVKVEDGDVKKVNEVTEQELLLDMMPIPRKTNGKPTAPSSATAFVIPKRTFAITAVAGTKEVSQEGRAEDRTGVGRVRRPLDTPVLMALPPLPSPESSPKVAKQEPVPPQKKRTKNFVPVKSSAVSPQDRVLMRLSRNRNSIFMAAAELTAQVPDLRSHKKPTTRMVGYEVFDADKQTLLPDLIPRLSCATKREMGSNQEAYPASFFGVSLSTPKAKGETTGPDDCGGNEQNARKICCYEELRFERPDDRQFYQQKMYGTTFVPQMLRGWITLIIRNARFERKSTGFRFNQGRDREEFAASLSKRYTINKSVPRCDIPRENWQKLMRNQPGNVYLHYYNREDAEQASQVFRDDLGHPLQLKIDYKAGVVMTRSPSPGIGPQTRNPRGSYLSDGGAPEPSPVSSQNESAHSTPSWRRERQPASQNDLRYSRYDRGAPPPPVPWPKVEGRYVSGNKRPLLERRSRSRSRSKSFHSQQRDPAGHDSRGGSNIRERPGGGDESAFHSDAETPAWKRARVLAHSPRRSRSSGQDKSTIGGKSGRAEGRQEDGPIKSNTSVAPAIPTGASNGGDRRRTERSRSPLRRWQHEPNNPKARRDSLSGYPRDRSRGPVTDQQQPIRDSGKRRSRSRSPPRPLSNRGGRSDFNGGRHTKERRSSREFGRGDAFANSVRGRRMQSDRGRGGFTGRRGGGNARP